MILPLLYDNKCWYQLKLMKHQLPLSFCQCHFIYINTDYWYVQLQLDGFMAHTEFWRENSRTFHGLKSFFRLHFPTIWHQITWNTITNKCTAVLSNFLVCKTMLFNRGYFIQVAFTTIQGKPWKNQGLFKDIQQFFQFLGLFKDMMFFQGLFKVCADHRIRRRLKQM